MYTVTIFFSIYKFVREYMAYGQQFVYKLYLHNYYIETCP